jgi:outer membrane protein assembly factor BamD
MKRLISIALLSISCIFLQSCSNKNVLPDPFAKFRSLSADTIFKQGEHQASKKQFSRASDSFMAFEALYPDNKQFRSQVILDSIYTNYMAKKLTIAEAQCERFLIYYPYLSKEKLAYVYYMRGLISYKHAISGLQVLFRVDPALLGDENFKLAFDELNTLVNEYPQSKYTPDAIIRMHYVRDMFARHQLLVAQYYYYRKAYVASANRALGVVLHFNGVASAPSALQLLYLSYQKMGLKTQADEVKSILDANKISTHYVPIRYDLLASLHGIF